MEGHKGICVSIGPYVRLTILFNNRLLCKLRIRLSISRLIIIRIIFRRILLFVI